MDNKNYDSLAISMANQIESDMEKDLLAPFIAGVYFSKYDLLGIAEKFDATKRIDDRKKTLKEIFKYVDTKEDLKKLLTLFLEKIDGDIAVFKEIESNYKYSDTITHEWTSKANLLKEKIDNYLKSC
ncbi:MAG: hypothetical protein QG567_265 [Campylobacterota bacterium]|nr:hypothetical protein [Campylobacterota bacterium]